jgi:hypothetical protein
LTLVPLAILLAIGAVWLARQPGYARPWEQEVRVVQKLDATKNRTTVELSSGDYLRGVRAEIGGRVEDIKAKACYKVLDFPLEMNWLAATVRPQLAASAGEKLARVGFELAFERQPYTVTLRLRSNRPFRVETSNVHHRRRKNRLAVSWQYFPAGVLRPEFELRLAPEATLDADIRAVFLETPVPVVGLGENVHFVRRSEIIRRIEILKP